MSERLTVEYSSEGIATIKEGWYAEEIAQRQRRGTFEAAEKLSSLVEEARRRQVTRKLAEDMREVLAEQTRLKEDRDLEVRFRQLAEQWYLDTALTSSYLDKILHPAYQTIISLGQPMIPFILRELQAMPDDWFWALRILGRDDPVRPEQAGDMQAMADAWLEWGRRHDYI